MKITVRELKSAIGQAVREARMTKARSVIKESVGAPYQDLVDNDDSYAITNALDAVDGAISALDFLDDAVGNGETLRTAVNTRIMTRYADSHKRFKAALVELRATLQESQS